MAQLVWKMASRGWIYSLAQVNLHRHHILHRNLCTSAFESEEHADDIKLKDTILKNGLTVYQSLQDKGIDACLKKSFLSLYQHLISIGVKESTVESQFLQTPDLLEYPVSNWKIVCDILTENGVGADVAFSNICKCPGLLQANFKVLEQHMKTYSEMFVGKHPLLHIVQRNPELYVAPPTAIYKRMSRLNNIFPPAELKILLRNNPNILLDNWDSISEKLMYINEEMGLEQPHIAASEALQRSLLHIKMRHQFLSRAGLYIKPNLLRDKQSHKKNPELSMITDTSNKFFATKVARLTDYEYEVFCQMIKEEHESILDESDSDDDGGYK